MKRQILSFILACVMIFGVVALAGCNNGTQKQVEDLQAQVNELKSQSEANAASAAQANKQLADEKASSEAAIESQKTALESMESALKVLQDALDATKTELQTTKEELNQALEEKKEELEQAGGIPEQSYDEATDALPEKKNELKAAYEAAKDNATVSAWLYTEDPEANLAEIEALYKKALNDLDKATSVEKQDAIIAKFIADASAFVPVPMRLYNKMKAYIDVLIVYDMVDDILEIADDYEDWLDKSGKTAADFDAYMAEQGVALDTTLVKVVKKFAKVAERAEQLEAAVRDAAAINARVAAVKADLEKEEEEDVHLEADWEELKQLRIDIPAWEHTYFPANTPYYQERPLVGTQGTPNGSANWQLIDRAMVDEAERLMRDLLNKYIDAGLTFIMSVEALDETPNLLSYGKINVAKKALDDYIKLRKIDFEATFDFILAEFGELVEPDITPFIAEFAEKRADYQKLVEEARDAYNDVVSQKLVARAAVYFGYNEVGGYKYATDAAKTLFMTTSTYPVYDVNPILDWYRTYGVWRDADGNIVDNDDLTDECEISWTSDEYATAWTWPITTDRADIVEILEDAVEGEKETVIGYMLNYTNNDYFVWTIDSLEVSSPKAVPTVKLIDKDYAWVTGYDMRTIEIAIEALMAETPILTGSEAMVNEYGYLAAEIREDAEKSNLPPQYEKVYLVSFTPAKYIEKFNLLRGLVRDLEDKTDGEHQLYYWDLDTEMDNYHLKNYVIEGLNAYAKEVQIGFGPLVQDQVTKLWDNDDITGTKAIRQLLIQYVGDIEAILPTGTVAEMMDVLDEDDEDDQEKAYDLFMHAFYAASSFAAVEEISEAYLAAVEAAGEDEDLLSALYGVYAQAVISEQIDDQIIPCLLRTFAQKNGFIGIANTVTLTKDQFALALGQEENPEG